MCGIAGIVHFDGSPVAGEAIRTMARALDIVDRTMKDMFCCRHMALGLRSNSGIPRKFDAIAGANIALGIAAEYH